MTLKIIENRKIKSNKRSFNNFMERFHDAQKNFKIDCRNNESEYEDQLRKKNAIFKEEQEEFELEKKEVYNLKEGILLMKICLIRNTTVPLHLQKKRKYI